MINLKSVHVHNTIEMVEDVIDLIQKYVIMQIYPETIRKCYDTTCYRSNPEIYDNGNKPRNNKREIDRNASLLIKPLR